jgi:ribonuclease BN (tRNA processing enzyme)
MKRIHGLVLSLLLACPCLASAQPAAPARDAKAVWVTLGTGGGPQIQLRRSRPANALLVGDTVYLFDTGAGVQRQMLAAGVQLRNVRAIFISHHHIDHDAGLGQLIASRWMFNSYRPLPIVGPPGTVDMVKHLVASNAPVELAPIGAGGNPKPPMSSTVAPVDMATTMDAPVEVYRDDNIRVLAVTNTHYHFAPGSAQARLARSYAFRVETPGRTFVYTGDTGPSAHVERLAQGADVLVAEVIDLGKVEAALRRSPDLPASMLPSMMRHMEEDHLTPSEIGKLAAKAKVKEVVLTHLSPGDDSEEDLSGYTAGIKPEFQGDVRLSKDLDRF